MNIFEALFVYQYGEMERDGRGGDAARRNGVMLPAICLTMNIATVFSIALAVMPSLKRDLEITLRGLGGKTIGALGAAALFLVIAGLLHRVCGTPQWFDATTQKYLGLAPLDRTAAEKFGIRYFLASLLAFGGGIALQFLLK